MTIFSQWSERLCFTRGIDGLFIILDVSFGVVIGSSRKDVGEKIWPADLNNGIIVKNNKEGKR